MIILETYAKLEEEHVKIFQKNEERIFLKNCFDLIISWEDFGKDTNCG